MNILLTGSGGFIGKNLKSYFEDKYKLFTPRSFELDLTSNGAVKKYFSENDIDFIIHCATTGGTRGIEDKPSTLKDNLEMTENILEYKKPDCRVILFGSGAMYGKDRNLNKVKEYQIGEYVPKDLYGQSKMLISKLAEKRSDVLMLNIFACYGYGEKENRLPSYVINRVLSQKDIVINQNALFDYLFIEDLQKIIEYFIKNKPDDNIMNVTPSESITLEKIAQIVNSFTENPVNIIIKNRSLDFEYTGDNGRLIKNFPFEFTPAELGLRKLFEYKKG